MRSVRPAADQESRVVEDRGGLTVDLIRAVLAANPGLDKRSLRRALSDLGVVADTSTLNMFLYGHETQFEWQPGPGTSRLWYVRDAPRAHIEAPPRRPGSTSAALGPTPLDLYPWQRRALAAWRRARSRGVVEAVTGAGKTRLALQAILEASSEGRKVAVIVPTIELARQWERGASRHRRRLALGLRYSGSVEASVRAPFLGLAGGLAVAPKGEEGFPNRSGLDCPLCRL
jgi:Type III restriction enzyme, res subunit